MADERDVYRRKTPPVGVAQQIAAPEEVFDVGTGRCEGPELWEIRRKRPTSERLERLEKRADEQDKTSARMEGKIDTLLGLSEAAALERESRRKHLPATIRAIGWAVAVVIAALLGYGVAQ